MTTYPVGLSRDLKTCRVMRAQVDGADLAIWRDSKGAVAAWNNRCPHRGMRLSHGFVRNDHLACLYHGWQYSASGQCTHIPAHPDLDPPATIRTIAYDAVDASGVIWASVQAKASPPDLPAGLAPLRSFTAACSAESLLARVSATTVPFSESPVQIAPSLWQFGEDTAALLCNPIGPDAVQVHVLLTDTATLERRRAMSRWCEALRQAAEAQTKAAA